METRFFFDWTGLEDLDGTGRARARTWTRLDATRDDGDDGRDREETERARDGCRPAKKFTTREMAGWREIVTARACRWVEGASALSPSVRSSSLRSVRFEAAWTMRRHLRADDPPNIEFESHFRIRKTAVVGTELPPPLFNISARHRFCQRSARATRNEPPAPETTLPISRESAQSSPVEAELQAHHSAPPLLLKTATNMPRFSLSTSSTPPPRLRPAPTSSSRSCPSPTRSSWTSSAPAASRSPPSSRTPRPSFSAVRAPPSSASLRVARPSSLRVSRL